MVIKDYTVVVGSGSTVKEAIEALRRNVIAGIRRGWQPLGGVTMEAERLDSGNYSVAAAQAMVEE
jgi:hypothetical protein